MESLKDEIGSTFSDVIATLQQSVPQQIDIKPPGGGWSIGQIAEHILICSRGIPDTTTEEAGRQPDEKIAAFRPFLLDDSQKFEADDHLSPRMTHHDREELIAQLQGTAGKLTHIAETRDLEKLCMDMELPQLGHLTRYEWLYFIICHTGRHGRQMQRTLEQISS